MTFSAEMKVGAEHDLWVDSCKLYFQKSMYLFRNIQVGAVCIVFVALYIFLDYSYLSVKREEKSGISYDWRMMYIISVLFYIQTYSWIRSS